MRKPGSLTVVAAALAFAVIPASASAAPPMDLGSPPDIEAPTTVVPQRLLELPAGWVGDVTSVSVQWLDCDAAGQACAPIPGATGSTYQLTPSDVGHTIRVQEIATNADGTSAPAVSAATAVIRPQPMPPVNTARPVISGQNAVGAVLRETPGSWSGTTPISFSYQWYRCDIILIPPKAPGKPSYLTLGPCKPIPGAIKATYTVKGADKPSDLYATVTATSADGSAQATPKKPAAVGPTTYLGPKPGGASPLWALPRNVPSVPSILAHGGVTGYYPAPSAGRLDITWVAPLNGKAVLIAEARATYHRRGRYKLTTRLTKRGKAALKRNYLLGVYISSEFTRAGESIPTTIATSLTLIVF